MSLVTDSIFILVQLKTRADKSNSKNHSNPLIMKSRVRKIANFFAFNLLFFALYLNFIHKDTKLQVAVDAVQYNRQLLHSVAQYWLQNPEKYLVQKQ